jgi:hypothetical protein
VRPSVTTKNILVVDEQRFGKICTALVELNGYDSEWASGCEDDFYQRDFERYDLVITSYPYGRLTLGSLVGKKVSLLVLSDFACEDLMRAVEDNPNFYCLVKPVDFSCFNNVVGNLITNAVI